MEEYGITIKYSYSFTFDTPDGVITYEGSSLVKTILENFYWKWKGTFRPLNVSEVNIDFTIDNYVLRK